MRLFSCKACGQTVFFENVRCMSCGHALGFLPELGLMSAIEPAPASDAAGQPATIEGGTQLPGVTYVALESEAAGATYRLCANSVEHEVCNWLVPSDDPNPLCHACRLNAVIPDLSATGAREAWQRLEQAKRRLVYSLDAMKVPVENRTVDPARGLAFSFMADDPSGAGPKVMTGHDDGKITINIAEADDAHREKTRHKLGEAYRTLLGHFRHEVGHYYWFRLVQGSPWEEASRALFGDEREDYQAALDRHYKQGAPADWPTRFVSAYATMHPSEDWAETWAHYLHMVDTLGTAKSYGVVVRPRPLGRETMPPEDVRKVNFDDVVDLFDAWIPLSLMLNSLNRSMGIADAYPFVIAEPVRQKIRFVHDVIRSWSAPAEEVQRQVQGWMQELAPRQEGLAAKLTPAGPKPDDAGTRDEKAAAKNSEAAGEATKDAPSASQGAHASM